MQWRLISCIECVVRGLVFFQLPNEMNKKSHMHRRYDFAIILLSNVFSISARTIENLVTHLRNVKSFSVRVCVKSLPFDSALRSSSKATHSALHRCAGMPDREDKDGNRKNTIKKKIPRKTIFRFAQRLTPTNRCTPVKTLISLS